MTEETKELLRQGIVPVILGNDRAARRLAARLLRTFGIPSILCGRRRTVWDLLSLTTSFRRLSRDVAPRLIAEQLVDLAADYEDCFMLLIPLREEDRALIQAHGDLLETRFVCRDPDTLWSDAMLDGVRILGRA